MVYITLNNESMETNHNSITVWGSYLFMGVISIHFRALFEVKDQGTEWSLKFQMFFGIPDSPDLCFGNH